MTDSMAARLERVLTDNEQLQTRIHVLEGRLAEITHRAVRPDSSADRAEEELDRAAVAVAEAIIAAPEDEERQEAAIGAAASAIAAAPRLPRNGNRGKLPSVWTDPRLLLLDAEGHAIGAGGQDLLARVNALPGPPCASVGAMRAKYRARLDAGLITPPARAAAKPAPAKPSTIPEEDKAEARQMIQQGRGARDLVAWFGWDLQEAQAFAADVRAEAKGRAA